VPRRAIEHEVEQRDDEKTATHSRRRLREQAAQDFAHDFRNGLAGVRGAVQIVRDALGSCPERDILGAALARLDRIDRRLRELLIEDVEPPCNTRSGVRRITLPPAAGEDY
jgi:nitrogen-specific signal transduction histidine kinase